MDPAKGKCYEQSFSGRPVALALHESRKGRSGGESNSGLLDRVFDTLPTNQSFLLVASDPKVKKPMQSEGGLKSRETLFETLSY